MTDIHAANAPAAQDTLRRPLPDFSAIGQNADPVSKPLGAVERAFGMKLFARAAWLPVASAAGLAALLPVMLGGLDPARFIVWAAFVAFATLIVGIVRRESGLEQLTRARDVDPDKLDVAIVEWRDNHRAAIWFLGLAWASGAAFLAPATGGLAVGLIAAGIPAIAIALGALSLHDLRSTGAILLPAAMFPAAVYLLGTELRIDLALLTLGVVALAALANIALHKHFAQTEQVQHGA